MPDTQKNILKKQVLIISYAQFGYHSDPYYFALYLSEIFDIQLLCPDKGYARIQNTNLNVNYIKIPFHKRLTKFLFVLYVIKAIKTYPKNSVCVIFRFPFCYLLPCVFKKDRFIYDIRSGGVTVKKWVNIRKNFIIKWNALFFSNITIISESLAELLQLNKNKIHVLPLGGRVLPEIHKEPDSLHLLYVGTFNNRNIEKTIAGYNKFIKDFSSMVKTSYTIIGFGNKNIVNNLMSMIENFNLQKYISFEGRKTQDELLPYFQKCNVGVSFIPITDYYNVQPPTKTFEYLLSGMIVLATSTYEHTRVINDKNGVLIEDTADSFYEGLKTIYKGLRNFEYEKIKESSLIYSWEYIVNNNLAPYLNSIILNIK